MNSDWPGHAGADERRRGRPIRPPGQLLNGPQLRDLPGAGPGSSAR